MEVISKLGVGPMSPVIIESVFSYSHKRKLPMMLICSKNQVDYDRGYVFKTQDYRKYINQLKKRYKNSKVYICRDHCGPGHNSVFDLRDTYSTIDCDIENGFDLIHIDFCFHVGDYDEVLNESKKAIKYILKKAPKTFIETGTDENSGVNIENLHKVESEMKFFSDFCQPHFFVTQTGTLIKETNQVGMFHLDYIKKVKLLSDKYNLPIKEHNADYLGSEEISKRKGLVGAVNVAPQFGVLQTQLSLFKAHQYGIDPSDFLEVSYRSRKWEKWLLQNQDSNKLLCSLIAGHYNFNTDQYKRLFDSINKHEDFSDTIQREMYKVFDLYIDNS